MTQKAFDLLTAEAAAIGAVLADAQPGAFGSDTPLPGWSVRDVIGHCGAAMTMLRDGTVHGFSPVENEADVELRRSWPIDQVITEYLEGLDDFIAIARSAPPMLDGLARGMWIHGGDIRDGLGRDDAYGSPGVNIVVDLIGDAYDDRRLPSVAVIFDSTGPVTTLIGTNDEVISGVADVQTFVRLAYGRNPDPARYRFPGIDADDLRLK